MAPASAARRGLLLAAALLAVLAAGAVAVRKWRQAQAGQRGLELLIVPFARSVIDPAPLTGPDCCTDVLAIGDLNGDGRPDIVLGAQESKGAGLAWYENPSWTRHEVARGEFTTDGKTADMDGDGDIDIIVGEFGPGLTWYENPGPAGPWKAHRMGAGYVHDIEVGDLDGDGRAEALTCDKKGLALWMRAPSGWSRHTLLTAKGEGLALGDIDGDGRLDAVFGARWLRNPGPRGGAWTAHWISESWPADTRVRAVDMNGDGRLDAVLTASEGRGRVSWFEQPAATGGAWREHPVSNLELEGAHSLAVADLDGDGDLDVTAAEMHTSRRKRVLNFINDGGGRWRTQTLAATGSHNMQAADLDGDGDIDLAGKNYAGAGRALEMWENLSRDLFGAMSPSAAPFLAPGWRYTAIDGRRDDDQRGKMGLVFTDFDGDGRPDVAAGSFVYRNPGPDLTRRWKRERLGENVDVLFAVDADSDGRPDLVAARDAALLWLKTPAGGGSVWTEKTVGAIPQGRTQGYVTAQIEAGGLPELVFTRGNTLLYVRIPAAPESAVWPQTVVSTEAEEEGVAAADVDADGDQDIIATRKAGQEVVWFENPGAPRGGWVRRPIGAGGGPGRFLDRIAAADVNLDGVPDVIASEESQDWAYNSALYWFEGTNQDWAYNSALYWFEGTKRPGAAAWTRRRIGVLRSANSLDVRDMDGDGLPDVVAAEHTDMRGSGGAANNLTVIFANRNKGASWQAMPVEAGGHSSHLGARVCDLNLDGRPDIVSLGWNQFRTLHLWWRPGAGGAGNAIPPTQ